MNTGSFADKKVAKQWITWIESLSGTGDSREREIYPWLSGWISAHRPEKILEVGSGQGVCSEKVTLGTAEYVGVEPSASLRARAHELYPDKKFVAGSAEVLPFNKETFDAVMSVFVWLHIENLSAAAQELARVLKPGGKFAIVTANPDQYSLWKTWFSDFVIEGKRMRGNIRKRIDNHEMYLHNLKELRDSLEEAGLAINEVTSCGHQDDTKLDPGFAVIFSGTRRA